MASTYRNLSPQQMFMALAREHQPEFAFRESTRDFGDWKSAALPQVLGTLGDFPPTVPPNPELTAEWKHDGLVKQRWVIDVGPHISAGFQLNKPAGLATDESRPAILCCHGHGPFGKEPVMGNDSSSELRSAISKANYDYGHQMSKAGFITYAIDWMGFGERNDGRMHNQRVNPGARDWCNLYYLHATMLGMTSLSLNIAHAKAATDFAVTLPEVDDQRLGVMGLSGGGTMSLFISLCDERMKATEVICYSEIWECFGFRDNNYCGMQVAPGLYKLVDLPDLQGLLAPRPLLVDIGVHDSGFLVDDAMSCYRQVETIYAAAGVREQLELDLFSGEHSWGGNKSVDFFSTHLRL